MKLLMNFFYINLPHCLAKLVPLHFKIKLNLPVHSEELYCAPESVQEKCKNKVL